MYLRKKWKKVSKGNSRMVKRALNLKLRGLDLTPSSVILFLCGLGKVICKCHFHIYKMRSILLLELIRIFIYFVNFIALCDNIVYNIFYLYIGFLTYFCRYI